jgi:HlyD family secretion protein
VRPPTEDRRRRRATPTTAVAELEPGQTRKETEGVFIVKDGIIAFAPIKLGISGDKYFEILSGLEPGAQVVTGPYNSVRGLADGDPVTTEKPRAR